MFVQLLGFSFGFGSGSACRSPEGICSSLRQDGVKGTADSGALDHSGQGEGAVWMRGEPATAEASMTLHQPEASHVFSRGSCLWITGRWQWRAAQAPRRADVESDLCLHTGFLVAAAAALRVSCPCLGSAQIAATHACLWSSFKRRSESPLLAHQETNREEKVSCLFGSSRFFPGLPPS